jgi:hypothetical protein
MSRRTTGTMLLAVSALLYIARYVAAAIFGSGMMGWSSENFRALMQYVGPDLTHWSAAALVFGVLYLWAEVDAIKHSK